MIIAYISLKTVADYGHIVFIYGMFVILVILVKYQYNVKLQLALTISIKLEGYCEITKKVITSLKHLSKN